MSRTTRHNLNRHRRGYAMLTVMLFLTFAFGAWAIFYHTTASSIRMEEARTRRELRTTWTAPAMAQGLRLLESGPPPSDPYSCKVTVASDSETRYVKLTFNEITTGRYSIVATPTDAEDPIAEAPVSFLPVPNAPTNLLASAASSSQINLTWGDVAFDNGYVIERSPNGSSGWTQIGTAVKDATNYTATGLSALTTYYFRVCGTNTSGNGEYSDVASTTTWATAPPAPGGLAATPVSSSRINLSWNDVATETGYLLETSPDGSSNWTQVVINSPDVTNYSHTGLVAGTAYYYRVRAFNLSGNSSYSSVANATTVIGTPSAPSGLAATAASNTQINLTWNDNSNNESGFKVERSPDNNTWTLINTTSAGATSYSSTGLSTNTLYYYRVRATNAGGDSSYTSTASATTLPNAPSVPSNLNATAANSSQINLTWTDNSTTETGFKIERSPNSSTWTQITTVSANVTSYSNTGLSASTTYYYRIRAYNTGGNSAYTAVDSVATTAIPAIPTGLAAAVASSTKVNLTWTDNSNNETGFRIQRSTNNSTWTTVTTTAAGATSYQVTGLSTNTLYYFRIRANGASGNSANTASVSATPH